MKKAVLVATSREIFDFISKIDIDGEFVASHNLENALSTARSIKPSIAIVDEEFDGEKGKKLAEDLLGMEHPLPVVLLIPHGSVKHPKSQGIHTLEKPFSLEDIKDILEENGIRTRPKKEEIIDLAFYVENPPDVDVEKKVKKVAELVDSYSDVFGGPSQEALEAHNNIQDLEREFLLKLEELIEAIVKKKVEEYLSKRNQD